MFTPLCCDQFHLRKDFFVLVAAHSLTTMVRQSASAALTAALAADAAEFKETWHLIADELSNVNGLKARLAQPQDQESVSFTRPPKNYSLKVIAVSRPSKTCELEKMHR